MQQQNERKKKQKKKKKLNSLIPIKINKMIHNVKLFQFSSQIAIPSQSGCISRLHYLKIAQLIANANEIDSNILLANYSVYLIK